MHSRSLNCTTNLQMRNEETNSMHCMQNYSLDSAVNRSPSKSTADLPTAERTNLLILHCTGTLMYSEAVWLSCARNKFDLKRGKCKVER